MRSQERREASALAVGAIVLTFGFVVGAGIAGLWFVDRVLHLPDDVVRTVAAAVPGVAAAVALLEHLRSGRGPR